MGGAGQPTQADIRALTYSVDRLREQMKTTYRGERWVREPKLRMVMFFLRGLMYGLGLMVWIAIVVPILIYALSTVKWVPLAGEFVSDVLNRVEVMEIRGSVDGR